MFKCVSLHNLNWVCCFGLRTFHTINLIQQRWFKTCFWFISISHFKNLFCTKNHPLRFLVSWFNGKKLELVFDIWSVTLRRWAYIYQISQVLPALQVISQPNQSYNLVADMSEMGIQHRLSFSRFKEIILKECEVEYRVHFGKVEQQPCVVVMGSVIWKKNYAL